MAARIEPNPSKVSRSLVTSLAIAFVVLSVIPLLLVSSLLGYFYFQSQREALFYQQELIAVEAATEVSGFIEQLFSVLEASAQVGQNSDPERQRLVLEKLLGLEDALREVILVDKTGQKIAEASRRSLIASSGLVKLDEMDVFAQVQQGQPFISAVYIDEMTSEPMVILAVPMKNVFGDFIGALLAEVNLKFMWDVIDQLQAAQTVTAYVVDKQGNLIASGDPARVLKGENLSQLAEVAEFISDTHVNGHELYTTGINGSAVVAVHKPLGTPDWAVITEKPAEEAYQSYIINTAVLLVFFLVIAILAAGAGVYASRYLTTPLLNLTQTATLLAAGEIELQAALEGPVEVVRLASAFNYMTAQLQESIGSLEERVVNRTRRLELVAILSERLSAILNLNQLLTEVVNQIKENFDYYHTHIYLIDEQRENLVVAAGTGTAGAEMKAKGHNILLQAPTSLVARAARTAEIVKVDNVREAPDWLPNLLLPNTYSEMAVPITLEGEVVGVLDVQEDKIAGLDEGDTNLLRSLANQIAVAMRNARLFEEVEAALAHARAAQEQYLEQAWQKAKIISLGSQHLYKESDTLSVDEAQRQIFAKAHQEALTTGRPTVISIEEGGSEQKVLVAPIRLRDQPLGSIQLYASGSDAWGEQDLAIIESVLDQLAQSAENLRLFEETRERAGRERTIREITDKLRAAPNLDRLLEIAARELGQRLGVRHTVLELGLEAETLAKNNGAVDQNGKQIAG